MSGTSVGRFCGSRRPTTPMTTVVSGTSRSSRLASAFIDALLGVKSATSMPSLTTPIASGFVCPRLMSQSRRYHEQVTVRDRKRCEMSENVG